MLENFAAKEADLLSTIEDLKSKIHMEDLPKIQELEQTQEQLLSDLKEISGDCEHLRQENETLENKLNNQKQEMEEIIDVKDDQIMKLQDVNEECTKVRAELEEKEKQDVGHLQEWFEELERVSIHT